MYYVYEIHHVTYMDVDPIYTQNSRIEERREEKGEEATL